MAQEQIADLGYMAIKKQSAAATAVTPNVYVPLYKHNLQTFLDLDDDTAIIGTKAARNSYIQGQRHHGGEFTILAEPNTTGLLIDSFLTKSGTSGSNPYTHSFGLSATNPHYYTIDLAEGRQVVRFWGVQTSKITPSFDKNKMMLTATVAGLKSFTSRTVASVSGSGPYTVTLGTDYDPAPTDGLVTSDLLRFYDVSADSYIDCTVASVASTTTITTSTDVSALTSGDILTLRPATPSYSTQNAFTWSGTEFRFADDATTALSATQTRLEPGSTWSLMHNFESEEGSKRSGGLDPASLIRLRGDAEFTAKAFFDSPSDLNRFNARSKRACVIRHFSNGGTYELRITLNNLTLKEGGVPPLDKNTVIYQEQKWGAAYDTSDAQIYDVKVINSLSSI